MNRPNPPAPRPWFPAKSIGIGWGVPTCWQGWAVLAGYLACILVSSTVSTSHPVVAGISGTGATAVLLAICRAKGEPLRWRGWPRRSSPSGK